jgi:hypothetical protein
MLTWNPLYNFRDILDNIEPFLFHTFSPYYTVLRIVFDSSGDAGEKSNGLFAFPFLALSFQAAGSLLPLGEMVQEIVAGRW